MPTSTNATSVRHRTRGGLPEHQVDAYRLVCRRAANLPPSHGMLLARLVDQSYGLGRESYRGTLQALVDGRDGKFGQLPFNLRMATYALRELKELGLVRTERHRYGLTITVDLDALRNRPIEIR